MDNPEKIDLSAFDSAVVPSEGGPVFKLPLECTPNTTDTWLAAEEGAKAMYEAFYKYMADRCAEGGCGVRLPSLTQLIIEVPSREIAERTAGTK